MQQYNYYILYTRGESLNIFCAIISIFDIYFWKKNFFLAYCRQIIRMSSPKLVITLIDNNKNFYLLSSENKNILTLFIQNGVRTKYVDIFSNIDHNEKYRVDFMLVFNRIIAEKYKNYIKGKTFVIGSLKNNHFQGAKKKITTNTVVFISCYRPKVKEFLYLDDKNQPIYWEDFYNLDSKITAWLGEWCYENNKELVICSNGRDKSEEKNFYSSILNKKNSIWHISNKDNIFSSYETIDKADIVINTISTLGYEAFGRGKKTAFFTGRGKLINDNSRNFAWPLELDDNGPFWCNNPKKTDFYNILNDLNKLSSEDWEALTKEYQENIMYYNPKNTKLKKILKDVLKH